MGSKLKQALEVVIFPNFNKPDALFCTRAVCDKLIYMGIKINADYSCRSHLAGYPITFGNFADIVKNSNIAVAIGGDGTILACAKLVGETPILGVNSGRLGFMATIEASEIGLFEFLLTKEYSLQRRMLLDVNIYSSNGHIIHEKALNDVVLSRTFSRLADFDIWTEGKFLTSIRSDGIIVSTPTGSTAYALSAGGPIIEHSMECIQLTPVCSHALFSRPIIFDPERELEIRSSPDDKGRALFSVDGQNPGEFLAGSKLTVRRSSQYVHLIDLKGSIFYDAVRNKLTQFS